MGKQKFVRLGYWEYSKLGLRRNKKLKYRKARGRDNKVRLKMKGHLRNVEIGFKTNNENRGLVMGKRPVYVTNIEGLKRLKTEEIAIIAKLGNKKKLELANYCKENKIRPYNLDPTKFIKKIEDEKNKRKEKTKLRSEKRKEKEKSAKVKEKKDTEDKKTESVQGIESKVNEETKNEEKEDKTNDKKGNKKNKTKENTAK